MPERPSKPLAWEHIPYRWHSIGDAPHIQSDNLPRLTLSGYAVAPNAIACRQAVAKPPQGTKKTQHAGAWAYAACQSSAHQKAPDAPAAWHNAANTLMSYVYLVRNPSLIVGSVWGYITACTPRPNTLCTVSWRAVAGAHPQQHRDEASQASTQSQLSVNSCCCCCWSAWPATSAEGPCRAAHANIHARCLAHTSSNEIHQQVPCTMTPLTPAASSKHSSKLPRRCSAAQPCKLSQGLQASEVSDVPCCCGPYTSSHNSTSQQHVHGYPHTMQC